MSEKEEKRGVTLRMEQLERIEANIKIKEKEERRLIASSESKQQTIKSQNETIIENKGKSNSLDKEIKAKTKDNKEKLKSLDTLVIDKKNMLLKEVADLKNDKEELEMGVTNIKKETIEAKEERQREMNNLVTIQNDTKSAIATLKSLNKSITKDNNMAKKAKENKELALNELASKKIEENEIEKNIEKLKKEQVVEQEKLSKLMTKADYMIRYRNNNISWEAYNEEVSKGLGIPFTKFQQI